MLLSSGENACLGMTSLGGSGPGSSPLGRTMPVEAVDLSRALISAMTALTHPPFDSGGTTLLEV